MLANLKDYRPKRLVFKLSDKIKEKFPTKLFDGAKNPEEVIKAFNEEFNATFPENVTAIREMDKFEIEQTREEYCLKQENDVPKRMTELADAIETAKRIKKDAEERYDSLLNQIRELAATVKEGVKEVGLSPTNTARIALNGHYLYYSWVDDECQLVKAEPIPEWDKRSLWSQEDRNRYAMKKLFGYDFPEVVKPVQIDENEDNDDD